MKLECSPFFETMLQRGSQMPICNANDTNDTMKRLPIETWVNPPQATGTKIEEAVSQHLISDACGRVVVACEPRGVLLQDCREIDPSIVRDKHSEISSDSNASGRSSGDDNGLVSPSPPQRSDSARGSFNFQFGTCSITSDSNKWWVEEGTSTAPPFCLLPYIYPLWKFEVWRYVLKNEVRKFSTQ